MNMHRNAGKILIIALVTGAMPFLASAATAATAKKTAATVKNAPLYYAAWLPFWTTQAGKQEIALNLYKLDEISPFSYEIVNSKGAIADDLHISSGAWDSWFSAVHDGGGKIVPTIAWFDPDGIEALLSTARTRQAEEDKVAALVKNNGFDGIDIDFEGMYPATRPYFSLFVEGLAMRLHPAGKELTCTVTPREPLDSLYLNPPTSTVTYAENYTVLNQYCDEVRIMAYDQKTLDIKLDASKGDGTLYAPTADPDWVTKLIRYAVQYVNPKKIMLGVPTYGYEYEVSWANGYTKYQQVRAFDYFGAMDRADSIGQEPVRDNAGELSLTYQSSTYIQEPASLTSYVPSSEPAALMNPSSSAPTTFFISFPDATSELQKVALAKEYGLKGVIFFKADGEIDPAIWNSL